MSSDPILVCFDGSPLASEAIRETAEFFPAAQVEIVTAWRAFQTARLSSIVAILTEDVVHVHDALRTEARAVADRGVHLAAGLGLSAEACVVESQGSEWRALVEHVNHKRYRLVVLGARSESALQTALLGGVSSAMAAHANCPVLIVHDRSRRRQLDITEVDVARQLPALGVS